MSSSITITSRAKIDALTTGLLTGSGSWSVHLGTSSPAITPASSPADFLDTFYPEYAVFVWTPTPIVVDLDFTVRVTGASVSFAAPSMMPQLLTTIWITYTSASHQVELLEAFYLPNAPFQFGPGGDPFFFNVEFDSPIL